MAIWEKVNDSMRESNHYLLFSPPKADPDLCRPVSPLFCYRSFTCGPLFTLISCTFAQRKGYTVNTSALQWGMKWLKMLENVFSLQSLLSVPFKKYHSSKSAVRSKVITADPAARENT